MATFHIDEHALTFSNDTIDAFERAFHLPSAICDAHRKAMVGTDLREQLGHAIQGLDLIHKTDSKNDDVQANLLQALQHSLRAIASRLSIVLYQNMEKCESAWDEARETVEAILKENMVKVSRAQTHS